jgi:hypothetical protein
MLNNRRRMTDAEFRRARRGAGVSSLFALKPPQIVILGFGLVGLLLIVSREFAPHNWPGACYEAHFESRGGRSPGMIQVCLKHIPFANAISAPAG